MTKAPTAIKSACLRSLPCLARKTSGRSPYVTGYAGHEAYRFTLPIARLFKVKNDRPVLTCIVI